MKKSLLAIFVFCVLSLIGVTPLLSQVSVPGDYATINLAISSVTSGTTINLVNASYNENVVVSKDVIINGLGIGSTTITPTSGVGITVTFGGATIQNLTVANCKAQGIYAHDFSGLTLLNVGATGNGTNTVSSGVSLVNVTGSVTLTNVHATGNTRHGLEIGNGSSGVHVVGGDFSSNGSGTNQSYGGGITIYADPTKSVSNVAIDGALTANSNTTAGIYLFCDSSATISNTVIGASGSITLNDNGNATNGGAAVIVYGPCSGTQITASSTRSVIFQTAGLVIVGTNSTGNHSPTGTVVKNSTLTGFATNSPAGTMKVYNGTDTLICTNDVDAKVGNLINGVSTGFQVEDLLTHKVDNLLLGRFLAPGHTVYVTPNSGSINRGIACADAVTYDTVKVEDGTYAENVVVGKAIAVIGQGANTKVNPGSGTSLDVTSTGVSVDSLNIYLYGAFAPANSPTFANNSFTFRAQAKVFLQGPYSSGSMTTTLNTGSLIPLAQPYNVAPFNYTGTESVGSIPANVTDWILVELRSGTTGATKTAIRACFLKNDGTVLETDGTTGVWESAAIASGYDVTSYVVIRHRNHLAVMSAAGMAMPNGSPYDFTIAEAQAFGTTPMKDLTGSGPFGMWAGDANGDGVIKYNLGSNDRALIYTRIGSGSFNATAAGYHNEDLNLDGVVKYNLGSNDRAIIYTNIGSGSFNATKSTQVPN